VHVGGEVSPYYDPLVAKLVAWAPSRMEAIARMRRALDEYIIAGVRTTIPFHRWLMDDEEFQAGCLDTSFIERRYQPVRPKFPVLTQDLTLIAAALDYLAATQQVATTQAAPSEPERTNPWKLAGRVDLLRRRG
jgi:acetyl/propionyl-CoA carboxylase alpha subunit